MALLFIAATPVTHAAPARFDLLVSKDAVYRVSFESLSAQGLAPQPVSKLSLSNAGQAVPVWVENAADGSFGPGSALLFVGRHQRGPHSHFDEHSRQNAYRLRFEGEPALFGKDLPVLQSGNAAQPALVRRHMEEDRIRVRFNDRRVEPGAEIWYWNRLSVLDKKPFELPVDMGEISKFPNVDVSLRINLRGWSFSHRPGDVSDHQVEVLWNGEKVAAPEWNGQAQHELVLDTLPRSVLRDGQNMLQLRVPSRRDPSNDNVVVDVSLLNWIKVDHVFDGQVEKGQIGLQIPEGGSVPIASAGSEPTALYSLTGERVTFAQSPGAVSSSFSVADPEVILLVGSPQTPDQIRRDLPSDLRNTEQQADYLMIAHGSLLEAARPLAEFHRERGLNVALIDVQDIFDEFNEGILSPHAIREFTSHAYHAWSKPAPRFVMLVGDASWDQSGEGLDDSNYADWTFQHHESRLGRFVKNSSTSYADQSTSRNLIPTLQVQTPEGSSASDSELVAVDGDDWKPDMAIGRIPVADPAEVSSIVSKLIDYQTQAPVGPWRRSFLLIANEETYMQRFTNAVALGASQHGILPTKVFPEAAAPDNSLYQRQLLDEFDEGRLLVHYLGHGGRYIWRTGPPDPRKNHDLFTLDHIDQLAPTSRLPVVLSMTCYSAPFDHPTADSIGEKFLRAENRGAVGVLAASWRNAPTQMFSDALIKHMMRRELSVGEAIMHAKQETENRILVQTYNYLGDPATRLHLPAGELTASLQSKAGKLNIDVDLKAMPELRGGQVMVDIFDAKGNRLSTAEHPLNGKTIVLDPLADDSAPATSVSVYAWHEARRIDAITRLVIQDPAAPATPAAAL